MTIKNETAFTKECMEGAMRASNFDNSRYKTFKLIYNMFGLIFGMMMIRELVSIIRVLYIFPLLPVFKN